jgi:hypothetical protein
MHEAVYKQINNTEFHVWDAVVAWRDSIYQAGFWNTTKSSYLTSMLKLIESEVVNVRIQLHEINERWLNEAKYKIGNKDEWSLSTKIIRKSCLNSFYNFIKTDFDTTVKPYRRHPKYPEIKHILSNTQEEELEKSLIKHTLSSVQDKAFTIDISPIVLCNAISKINERDAYIVWLMMYTGQPLESILDLPKRKEDEENPYMCFKDIGSYTIGEHIPEHIIEGLNKLCKNSIVYLFETSVGKRVTRTQITRNLKKSGRNIGLKIDLTPKVLHGYVCAYMSRDKRSELEKALGFSID